LAAAIRKLELAKKRADAEAAYAAKLLAAAKNDQAKAHAAELEQKADAKAADAAKQLADATADAKVKLDAAKAAQDAAKAAEAKKVETAKAAQDAQLALEPVAVFISRKTQKLYVRRTTHKHVVDGGERFDSTIEIPVTIREPDKPIGTHIFTAVESADKSLRWTAVTIDGAESAKDALARITIPQEVLDRIAPTAAPRSSIIISDEPLNRETNYRTEFVVVLNDQPQGGLAMRKPPPAREPWSDDGYEANRQGGFWGNPYYGNQRNPYYGDQRQRSWGSPFGDTSWRGGQRYDRQNSW
jgi:hypothetical protein